MVFDDPCVISAGESDDAEPADSENEDSAGSSEQPDTDDLFNRLLSHDDEDKPLRSESLDDLFGGNSLDLSALSDGSDLSSGDSNELASSSGLSLNNDLMSGFDDFGSENEKKDDNDPFGDLFSGLKL